MKNKGSYVPVSSVQPCYVTASGENRSAVTIGNCRGNLSRKKSNYLCRNVSGRPRLTVVVFLEWKKYQKVHAIPPCIYMKAFDDR